MQRRKERRFFGKYRNRKELVKTKPYQKWYGYFIGGEIMEVEETEDQKKHRILKQRGYTFDNLKREWVKKDKHKTCTIDEKFVKETLLGHFILALNEAN